MPKKATPTSGKMLSVSPDGTGGAVVGVGTARIWLRDRAAMLNLFAVMTGTPMQGEFERDREGVRCGPVTVVMAPFQAERVRSRLEELLTRPDTPLAECG